MYLIDGHNLIGSGLVPGVRLEQEDDEWRLVQYLRARQPQLRQPLVVVFDSGIPGGVSRELSGGGVRVVFASQRGAHADKIILERVQGQMLRGEIVVVTNDAVLRQAVQGLGAQVLSASEFVGRLQQRRKRSATRRPPRAPVEPKLSRDEVSEWLALFEEGKKRDEGDAP